MATFKIDQSELVYLVTCIYVYYVRLRVFGLPVYLFVTLQKKNFGEKSSNMEEQNFELRALMEYNSAEEFFDNDRYMLIDFN
jgi:hypothetical protein